MPRETHQARLSVDIDADDYSSCWPHFPYGTQAAFLRTLTVMLSAIIHTQGLGISYLVGWFRGEHDLVIPAPKKNQMR